MRLQLGQAAGCCGAGTAAVVLKRLMNWSARATGSINSTSPAGGPGTFLRGREHLYCRGELTKWKKHAPMKSLLFVSSSGLPGLRGFVGPEPPRPNQRLTSDETVLQKRCQGELMAGRFGNLVD